MAIKKKEQGGKVQIDLTGEQGNVFFLLGMAKRYARQLNLDATLIQKEMMSSDYENAIQVFDKNFGDYVDLLR